MIFLNRCYLDLILPNDSPKTIQKTKNVIQDKGQTSIPPYFVITCLDLDLIPRGLTIQKTPVVLGGGNVRRLLSIWEKTLQKTSRILLKHLKHYYKTTLLTTNSKIWQEESRMRRWTDFMESLTVIRQHTDRIFREDEERKCRKIKWLDKTEKRKRIRRKAKLPSPSENHRVQSSNLSLMHLSEDEMSLLLAMVHLKL